MNDEFKLEDIYDKHLSFIIGSGASVDLFPVLKVGINGESGQPQTIETLATYFDQIENRKLKTLLLMHYYKTCVEPILSFDYLDKGAVANAEIVIENYKKLIKTILYLIYKKKNNDRKVCNVFTTNYDGCFVFASDDIIRSKSDIFVLNDGAKGFFKRYLAVKNYNSYTKQSGTFDRYSIQIPQINLISLHGSGAWIKDNENIQVEYTTQKSLIKECSDAIPDISEFSKRINDSSQKVSSLSGIEIAIPNQEAFLRSYKKLPIVNPTKWKFHETVFEEHYYQMLRYLSYELERPNSVLITFGFSFADEHIFNLIKRSLANPSLKLFVFCYSEAERLSLIEKFKSFSNVTIITDKNTLNFTKFNSEYFCIEKEKIASEGAVK